MIVRAGGHIEAWQAATFAQTIYNYYHHHVSHMHVQVPMQVLFLQTSTVTG